MGSKTNAQPHRTWNGFRSDVSPGSDRRSVTVTFDYGGELRTLVAPSRRVPFDKARIAWGDTWDGEPCVSTPDSIYDDLTGFTKSQHGQDLNSKDHTAAKRDRFRRTGQPYG